MTDFPFTVTMEKEHYDRVRKTFATLTSTEERLSRLRLLWPDPVWFEYARVMLASVLVPPNDGGDDFFSFEEFTRCRESNSPSLNWAYEKLLRVPTQAGARSDQSVADALKLAGFDMQRDCAQLVQVVWPMELYRDELLEQWGGFRLVDEKHLPLGVLTMMRRKAVQWNMVL